MSIAQPSATSRTSTGSPAAATSSSALIIAVTTNPKAKPRGAYGDTGYTVDVLNAVSALKRYPMVDPERIGMWGHSMGGYLTLRAMVISPDIKVGVIWAGVVGSYEDMLYNWRRSDGPTPTPVRTAAVGD